ncbi:TPR repeat region-containing protein [Nesterenkonia halophila]|uniref:TPR repeat region-containing protein n=1 Tax=Nesterenkonia halophila TaxID=302044 RepID=UPI00129212DF|nr:hypothetical protein [Nesterenkonia halophila]
MTTALGLAGRNESASAALLAGSGDVDGFDGAELPDSFDSSRFVANVFDRNWEDDGAAVAGLIDWIASGSELSGHSGDAWYGLMSAVATTDAGVTSSSSPFREMLGGAQGSSLEVNPVFAQTFYETAAANLEEFSVPEGKTGGELLDSDDQVRVKMLVGTDDAASAKISASIQAYQARLVEMYVTGESGGAPHETNMAILQGKLEGGPFNAEMHKHGENVEAEERILEAFRVG